VVSMDVPTCNQQALPVNCWPKVQRGSKGPAATVFVLDRDRASNWPPGVGVEEPDSKSYEAVGRTSAVRRRPW